MKSNKGLTLIELIVFVVILGIAAAIAIPSVSIVSDSALKADARNLISDIRYTKELCLNNIDEFKIVFRKGGYEVIDSSGSKIRSYAFQKGSFLEDYELNIGSRKVNYMSYNLDGRGTASGTLIISNAKGSKKMKISITPVTGRTALGSI